MTYSEADVLRMIDRLYEAALDPSLMEPAFQGLADAVGGGAVSALSVKTAASLFNTANLEPLRPLYFEWQPQNSRTRVLSQFNAGQLCSKGLFSLRDLLTAAEVMQDPYHQEFLRPAGFLDVAAVVSSPTPGDPFAIGVERLAAKGAFEQEQLEFLAKIGPHMARTLALSMRIQAHSGPPARDLEAFVNRLDIAAIIINRNGEVAALNASAETLLGDGLRFHQRRLYTASHKDQSLLDRLLHAAFHEMIENIGSIALPRPSGKRPLVLQAVPLAKDYFPGQLIAKPGTVLLLIHDLETSKGPSELAALKALGLSLAESNVATVVGSGLSPQEASDQLGITLLTVRTHLKNIYQKLDLNRQGDLVQLVTKLRMVK